MIITRHYKLTGISINEVAYSHVEMCTRTYPGYTMIEAVDEETREWDGIFVPLHGRLELGVSE